MNHKLWKLLGYHLSTDVVNTFIVVFLNLFIWQKEKNVLDLAWFNLSMFVVWIFSYLLGAWVIHKTSMRVVFQLSNLFTVALFMILSFVEVKDPLLWLLFIGSVTGFMKGFLSSGKNLGVAAFGEKAEFASFFQYQMLFTKILQILTPLLFAFLLMLYGYKNVFLMMCVYSVLLLVLTFYIPKEENKNKEPLFEKMLSPFTSKKMKLLPISFLLGGVFSEFQTIFLVVFTFTITEDKFGVALLNISYSLLIIGLIYLYKKLTRISGIHWLFIGATTAFLGFGLIVFLEDWWLILANLLIVAGSFYFSTTYYSQQFEVMNELSSLDKERMLIWRECLLAFSRAFFLGMIILIGKVNDQTMGVIFCFVMVVTFLVPFVHKKIQEK